MDDIPGLETGTLPAPRTFDALKDLVATGHARLPKRLSQAAQYALAHPDDIALGTAASIAAAAGVQPSTLVRLAHHFGYGGFSDFQLVFRDRLKSRASTYEERLRKIEDGTLGGSDEVALLGGFIQAARSSLDALSDSVSPAQFAQCVDVLAGADTIYLVARRRAYPLAAYMAYAFAKLGIRSVLLDSANGIDGEIADLARPGDAAIACSFSPYAPDSVAQAKALSSAGVPLIALTDSVMSPLAACATHWLEVSENDFGGFRSLSAGMTLAMALPVAIAERRRHQG
ncbi:RpiR family transcriptional regulator [Hoeflea marina]|uniref:RpiR family transcriptional regulator n=1 Tax=Hoeflea marina TaxID=274592 RepID=A0A317PMA2_9HYPH|nr:MurR/RpiR family transcriptional regulator [Hoeflea marina]PWW02065.1 RpiR family transcriptional regulator [Hoeflea marina]